MAYRQLGTVLYLEEAEIDEAQKRFKKEEKDGCLHASHRHNPDVAKFEDAEVLGRPRVNSVLPLIVSRIL